nr:hypothetical protein [Actinomycetota bacterium]
MGRDRDQGRPVEPGETRAHGNDPDAVEVRRKGEDGYTGGQRREGDGRVGTGGFFADAAERRSAEARMQDL